MLFLPGADDDGLAFSVEQTAITCYYLSGMLFVLLPDVHYLSWMLFVPGAIDDGLAFSVEHAPVAVAFLHQK